MAGRSPYFGMLLWSSYIVSDFWLFVIAQAAISYVLILMSLRLFGQEGRYRVAATVAFVALLTSLPFTNAFLLADALASFGVLALLLLAVDRGRLAAGQRWFLALLLVLSAVSHLTHILILLGMTMLLALWAALGRAGFASLRWPIFAGGGAVLIGLLSVMITDAVVARQFGKRPLLVPLLTARFVADGPGADYLRARCPAAGFAVCAFRDQLPVTAPIFLWSEAPGHGVFLVADAETRSAMSLQDKAFARSVLLAYPLRQGAIILRNSAEQMGRFDQHDLNYRCFHEPKCWESVPAVERERMKDSVSGHRGWPEDMITLLQYATVILALVAILGSRSAPHSRHRRDIHLWLLLLLAALTINAVLGGAISEPQGRYQSRLIWLLPFIAWLYVLVRRTAEKGIGGIDMQPVVTGAP